MQDMSEDKPVAQDPDFFAVEPRFDCPHVDDSMLDNFAGFLRGSLKEYSITSKTHVFAALKCETCQDAKENWVCLGCSKLFCSRYVQGHMAAHNSFSSHQIAFSMGDGSFWCYDCDSYITSVELGKLRKTFGFIKHKIPFGSLKDLSEKERILPILQELEKINDGQSTFKRSEFVEGIRSQKYNKICCITGAGISTSAGIPDFRSQGGLYHRLAVQYDLTTPEEIMTLEFFKKNPEPLYEIMKQFLTSTVSSHDADQAHELPQVLRRAAEAEPAAQILHPEHRRPRDRRGPQPRLHDPGPRTHPVLLLLFVQEYSPLTRPRRHRRAEESHH